MKQLLVGQIRELIEGQLIQGSEDLPILHAVCYSKQLNSKNTIIFARFKRMFKWDTVQKYMPCAIVIDKPFDKLKTIQGCTIIKVANLEKAYWKFVDYYRNLYNIPVIAITGTTGKSTTKDMVKHILKYTHRVHGTIASANGRPGHLNYLLGIDESTEVAVFETAVGRPGDITGSCKYFKPTIGVITNIGVYHLDNCKTLDAYIKAKAEIITALDNKGVLIVNADDENTKIINLAQFKGRIIYFGMHKPANFFASNVRYGKNGMDFLLTYANRTYPVYVPGYGTHQVYNALAALAVVNELGISMKEAAIRLRNFKNIIKHLEIAPCIGGSTIIDDTWNLSPSSLKAGLEVLRNLDRSKKKVALLGDVIRLGESYQEYYSQLGQIITDSGIDVFISFGTLAAEIASQASEKGFTGTIYSFRDIDDLYLALQKNLDEKTMLLVQCSAINKQMLGLVKKLRIK